MSDILDDFREWQADRHRWARDRTHHDRCHMHHDECMVARLAAEIARLSDEVERLRAAATLTDAEREAVETAIATLEAVEDLSAEATARADAAFSGLHSLLARLGGDA